jgi:hypothetical protein
VLRRLEPAYIGRSILTFSASFYLTAVATNVSAGLSCGLTNVLQ